MIITSIQSGALVLARRSGTTDTCIILQNYSGLVSSDGVLYYYAWSLKDQSFAVIYSTDIIGIIDDDFGMELELTYPKFESDLSYAANGFRWRAVTGINPSEVEPNGVVDISGPFDTDDQDD